MILTQLLALHLTDMIELKDTISLMLSDNYTDRLAAEYIQLLIRIRKLKAMLDKLDSGTLEFTPHTPASELHSQLNYMLGYKIILDNRCYYEGIDIGNYLKNYSS